MMSESQVILVRNAKLFSSRGEVSRQNILLLLERGIRLLTGESRGRDGWRRLFTERDRIGIKINTIGGRSISTRPETSLSLAEAITDGGVPTKNIIVWDRTNRELKDSGYRPTIGGHDVQIMGTDTDGTGYEADLVSHLNIGSRLSNIQSKLITASLSLAILKDHGQAGVTAGMKNYFGAIHNPNKYHDTNCDPYVAEVFDIPAVRSKHRLTVIDALTIQYHRGPSFHPQWAETYGGLIFSTDPVAADAVGWRLIEKIRAKKGLPSLKEENREPAYLTTAERMGLGTSSENRIRIIEEEVS